MPMDKRPIPQPWMPSRREAPRGDWLFKAWFVFCFLLAIAAIVGVTIVVVILLPHVVAYLDRG